MIGVMPFLIIHWKIKDCATIELHRAQKGKSHTILCGTFLFVRDEGLEPPTFAV
jgi:hypothetical protein